MQKLTAYYLLLFYAVAVCRPVTIWLADALAHSAFEHEHLATVHHQHGGHHVHYQIGKAAEDDAPQHKTTAPKAEDEITATAFVQTVFRIDRFVSAKYPAFNDTRLPFVFLSAPLPPPWFLPQYQLG